jgi:hypothetical protein
MEKLKLSFLLFCLVLVTNTLGQTKDDQNIYIILEPNQKKDSIQIEKSCLILLRDYPITISIPLGKSYEMILPKGTKYLVEQGTYQLENPMNAVLEFELVSADNCQ